MEVKAMRTPAYVCTLDPMSVGDMEHLAHMRAAISAANRSAERVYTKWGSSYIAKKRVTVKPRKAIEKQLVTVRNSRGQWVQTLRAHNRFGDLIGGMANAREFDVYIHDDRRNWEYSV